MRKCDCVSAILLALIIAPKAETGAAADPPLPPPDTGMIAVEPQRCAFSTPPDQPDSARFLFDRDLTTAVTKGRIPKQPTARAERLYRIDAVFDRTASFRRIDLVTTRRRHTDGIVWVRAYARKGRSFELIGAAELKEHYPTKPVPAEINRVSTVQLEPADATEIRLEFETDGLGVCIQELRFLAAATGTTSIPDRTPERERAYPGAPLPPAADSAVAVKGDFDADGAEEVLLQNPHLRLIVEPALGGVISSIVHTPVGEQNMTKPRKPGDWGGIFADTDWAAFSWNTGDWNGLPYEFGIESAGPQTATLHLWRKGATGLFAYVTIHKRYTLNADQARLQIDYELSNDMKAVVPVNVALWHHNALGLPGREYRFVWMEENGIKTLRPDSDFKQLWIHDPTRPWAGLVADDGFGLGIWLPYRYLKCFYCSAGDPGGYPTFEWRFADLQVPAGDSFRMTLFLLPFAGLGLPDEVNPEFAARLRTPGKIEPNSSARLQLDLVGQLNREYEVQAMVRRLPDGEATPIFTDRVALTTGRRTGIPLTLAPQKHGTYALTVNFVSGGRAVGKVEKALVIGNPSQDFRYLPPEPRLQAAGRKKKKSVKLNYTSTDVDTEHLPWAKPWVGGTVSALLLTDGLHAREMVELAQRFDFDVSSSYITALFRDPKYAVWNYYGDLTVADMIGAAERALLDSQPDVLVLSGNAWNRFTRRLRDEIRRRVTLQGTGLVWIQPSALQDQDAWDLLPVRPGARPCPPVTEAHYTGAGIALEALPDTPLTPYTVQQNGHVRARSGEHPLVVTGAAGAGRVVVLTYRADRSGGDPGRWWVGHGIVPNRIRDDIVTETGDYWEVEYALLARAVQWAARKEGAILLPLDAKLAQGSLTIDCRNDAETPFQASAELRILDAFGQLAWRGEAEVQVLPGTGHFRVPCEHVLAAGMNRLDVRLRAGDAIVAYGCQALPGTSPATIAELKIDASGRFRPGDRVAGTVTVAGNVAPAERTRLHCTLADPAGRILWRRDLPVPRTGSVTFSSAPLPAYALRCYLQASLLRQIGDRGQALHSVRVAIDVRRQLGKADLPVAALWPYVPNRGLPPHLMPGYWRQLKRVGVTGAYYGVATQCAAEFKALRDLGLTVALGRAGVEIGMGTSSPKAKQGRAEYLRTGDKRCLVRVPCLSDPEWLAQARERSAAAGGILAEMGSDTVYFGDENQFGGTELCFSPHCLAALRRWLQDQYGSLDALNREWATNFGSWEAVLPMTRDEVLRQADRSIGPWLDHQQFNDDRVANAFATMRAGLKSTYPQGRVLICGTQRTEPGKGADWWRLCRVLEAINPYGGFMQNDCQRCFNPDMMIMPCVGYNGWPSLRLAQHRFWSDLVIRNACGFAIYSGAFFVNPDFSLPEVALQTKSVLAELHTGLGRAIVEAEDQLAPVAVYYSPRSIYASSIYQLYNTTRWSVEGACTLLNYLNCRFDVLAYAQAEDGRLSPAKHRVLIMPCAFALSAAEIQAISGFVRAGGTVVTDLMPGILTAHGRKLDVGKLAAGFGAEQTSWTAGDALMTLPQATTDELGETPAVELPVTVTELGLPATTTALGTWRQGNRQGKAGIVIPSGKGRFILFGTNLFQAYHSRHSLRSLPQYKPTLQAIEDLFARILRRAGVTFPFTLTRPDGTACDSAAIYLRRLDSANLLTVLQRDPENTEETVATLHLPQAGWVYDLRRRRARGRTPQIELTLGPAEPAVNCFAVLPYSVEAVTMTVNRARVTQGAAVEVELRVKTDTGAAGRHIVRVELIDPAGRIVDFVTGNYAMPRGHGELNWPVALNETPGTWTLTVADVLSDKSTRQTIEITPR